MYIASGMPFMMLKHTPIAIIWQIVCFLCLYIMDNTFLHAIIAKIALIAINYVQILSNFCQYILMKMPYLEAAEF